jgi:hypothetical protein
MAPTEEDTTTTEHGVVDMKVTTKKSVGFYIRAASNFLAGVEAKEGSEAKEPVCVLNISALGEAINAAVSAATTVESKGLGYVKKVETLYPDMPGTGRGCPRILITMYTSKK